MLAVDTNVIVRLILADDAGQTAAARDLIRREAIVVRTTVLLETYWVLRRPGGLPHEEVLRVLTAVLGLPNVTLEEPDRVRTAVDLACQGMGFADALHIADLGSADGFATFDRDLIRAAKRLDVVGVVGP